jgi:hypothetical protein
MHRPDDVHQLDNDLGCFYGFFPVIFCGGCQPSQLWQSSDARKELSVGFAEVNQGTDDIAPSALFSNQRPMEASLSLAYLQI